MQDPNWKPIQALDRQQIHDLQALYNLCIAYHFIRKDLNEFETNQKQEKSEEQKPIPTLSPRCIDIEFNWALFS